MLSYIIWNTDPELFTIPEFLGIGPITVRWYGLLFAAAFLFGQQIMVHIFKSEKKPLADIDALTLYMLISTVLGARIGHFLFYEPEVLLTRPLEVFLPPFAGLASHGAAIGILTGLWLYTRSRKATGQSYLWVADRMVIIIALAAFFIRFGNLMNSEIVGRPSDVSWAFIFMQNFEYTQVPRHPAQLYEALSSLVLFGILFLLWNKKKGSTPLGSLTGIFLIWIFTLRFFYEFLKENQVSFEDQLSLNMGQILSIPAVLLGFYFLWKSRQPKIVS